MHDTLSHAAYRASPYRSIKHSTYFEAYDALFARYRGQPITFVEIGVLGGGSLFMWREFFGPQARIVGIDLNPEARKWEADGFEILIGSQSDPTFWRDALARMGEIDVVLDDGGHTYEQQIVTTECLLDAIRDGGMLVVEDTHTSYMKGFGAPRRSFVRYAYRMADRINRRFARLDGPAERRVWSIRIFESIVAFEVNRTASNRLSEPTDNGGADDLADDMRVRAQDAGGLLRRLMPVISGLPVIGRIARYLDRQIDEATGGRRTKRYFR